MMHILCTYLGHGMSFVAVPGHTTNKNNSNVKITGIWTRVYTEL